MAKLRKKQDEFEAVVAEVSKPKNALTDAQFMSACDKALGTPADEKANEIDQVSVSPQSKFAEARTAMNRALIERHDEIDMVLTALLARENPLMVGLPGTAKSFLIECLMKWISGKTTKFSILLNKHSLPDEVFGPLDIVKLKEGKYVRVMRGKLPEADFAFLDEIFKASTAILNTMLKILNERLYDKGEGEVKCPLRVALAASNEWPDANELGALFDRFVLRKTVKRVSKIGRRRLIREDSHEPVFTSRITLEELDKAHEEAMNLKLKEETYEALERILDELNREGIMPGDRRIKKAVRVAKAFAYLRGASEVSPVHLEVLKFVLWDDATEQEAKAHKIVCSIANPEGYRITELLIQAASVIESNLPEQAVTKLQDIHDQLEKLGPHERKEAAMKYVAKEIARSYNKVIRYAKTDE